LGRASGNLNTERKDHEQLNLEFDGNPDRSIRRGDVGFWRRVLATGAALVFLPARRADAFLFDIVLDPLRWWSMS
jgi:hypothetical protein